MNDNEELDWGGWGLNTAIGGATGVITAGAGAVGSAIATKVATTVAEKVIITGATSAVGGSISSTLVTTSNNAYEGKSLTDGLGRSILIGTIAGGAGSALGAGAGKLS
jgi:hypothetical protein